MVFVHQENDPRDLLLIQFVFLSIVSEKCKAGSQNKWISD